MKRLVALFCLLPGLAWGQAAVQQTGPVTNRKPVMWDRDHFLRQGAGSAGDVAGKMITGGDGVVGARCSFSASTDVTYRRMCFDASTAQITIDGTASALPLSFNINGTSYPFPGTGSGNVLGSATTVLNDLATFDNTTGTLIKGNSGAFYANQHGLAIGYAGSYVPEASNKLAVRNRYTGAELGPAAILGRLDYGPAGAGSNPNGIYGILWYNGAGNFTGTGAAVRGNAYTVAQVTAAIAAAGTGYTNGDTISITGGTCTTLLNTPPTFQLTVAGGTVTAATFLGGTGSCTTWPANPVSVSGGTGSGLTLNLSFANVNVADLIGAIFRSRHQSLGTVDRAIAMYADGCYNSGGGTLSSCVQLWLQEPRGAAPSNAYGIWVNGAFNAGVIASNAGVNINFHPAPGAFVTTSEPLIAHSTQTCSTQLSGGVSNGLVSSLGADCEMRLASTGTGNVVVYKDNQLSTVFSAAAASVNYLQLTGSATGVAPNIAVLGTDANINVSLLSKGTGVVRLASSTADNFFEVVSAATGSAPNIQTVGVDADIDFSIIPKGTGVVNLGYAATVPAVPANFAANKIIAIKANNVIHYIPAMVATW